MTMTGLPLAVVFFLFFFLFLIHFQQPIHIGLCRQKFPHFLTGTPVLGVGFLLFLQQFGILRLQVFDLGQLLHSHLIKGIFCRLMEQNFLLMFLPKFSGITGLAVGHIGLAGLGVVDDVGAQHGNLGHALLSGLDLIGQRIVTGRRLCCFCFQIGIIQQPVFEIGRAHV